MGTDILLVMFQEAVIVTGLGSVSHRKLVVLQNLHGITSSPYTRHAWTRCQSMDMHEAGMTERSGLYVSRRIAYEALALRDWVVRIDASQLMRCSHASNSSMTRSLPLRSSPWSRKLVGPQKN